MRHYYASQTYVSASKELDEVCRWLDSIGVRYSGTRVAKYQKIFADLARLQIANKLEAFTEKHSIEDWVNAVYESNQLVRIHEGLRSSKDPSLPSKLRDVVRSNELYVLDSESRSGRDFTFELTVVAKFVQQGYRVNFSSEADVEATLDDFVLFVECKRLKSPKQIEKRIKDGIEQLSRRYAASPSSSSVRGLLALSIGKIANPELERLRGLTDAQLGVIASQHNVGFIEKYKGLWQSDPAPQTLGALVVLDAPGEIVLEKKLVSVHEVALNNCVELSSPAYAEFVAIAERVFSPRT